MLPSLFGRSGAPVKTGHSQQTIHLFWSMDFIYLNQQLFGAGEPVLSVQNGGYKYGDGLFETLKVYKGHILLEEHHFQRLFDGMSQLKIGPTLERSVVSEQIRHLCQL